MNMKEEGIPVPGIMYHIIYNGRDKSNDYIISSDLFRIDMNYLKENGYTTIFISDLLNMYIMIKNCQKNQLLSL